MYLKQGGTGWRLTTRVAPIPDDGPSGTTPRNPSPKEVMDTLDTRICGSGRGRRGREGWVSTEESRFEDRRQHVFRDRTGRTPTLFGSDP